MFQIKRPVAGSLTEQRGQKANMKVLKEMLELCQLINSEGHQTDEPGLKGITFGELFNVSNKCFYSFTSFLSQISLNRFINTSMTR